MSGELNFDESRGELNLRNQGAASVTLPGVFIALLQFADLNARVNWTREAQGVAVDLGKIRFANADVSGELSGPLPLCARPCRPGGHSGHAGPRAGQPRCRPICH